MSALKKRNHDDIVELKRHNRPITQPDYDDEVTEEQLEELRKQVAPIIDSEEWELVDGPAW